MSKILSELKYSESHEWVRVEGDVAYIGVSDFAQKEMGDITYVDMPEAGDDVLAGEEFGALESVKASSELISPVSGTVLSVNPALFDNPEKVNEDPYGAWIIKVAMSTPRQVDSLMSAASYKDMIGE
jgi:glycine cleavage system H protein